MIKYAAPGDYKVRSSIMASNVSFIRSSSKCFSTIIDDALKYLPNTTNGIKIKEMDMHLLSKAFSVVQSTIPSFSNDFIKGLVQKTGFPELQNIDTSLSEIQPLVYQAIKNKCNALQLNLTKLSISITNNHEFLEIIKDIALDIKTVLASLTELSSSQILHGNLYKMKIETQRRQFVKCSKQFSSTLKEYFRNGDSKVVFRAAKSLDSQTDEVMTTVREIFD